MKHICTIAGRTVPIVATLAVLSLAPMQPERLLASFSDTQGTPYEVAFTYLANRGVVEGYPDGSGKPEGMLNRAEAMTVILRSQPKYIQRVVHYKQNGLPPALRFTDVTSRDWFGPYVHVAFEEGITTGYPDNTFRAEQLLRTEEAITLLLRSFGEHSDDQSFVVSPRVENKLGEWYTPYITLAIQKNLVMDSGQKLRLGTAITRGQFFDMLYRLLEINEQKQLALKNNPPKASFLVPRNTEPDPAPIEQPNPTHEHGAQDTIAHESTLQAQSSSVVTQQQPQPSSAPNQVAVTATTSSSSSSLPTRTDVAVFNPNPQNNPQNTIATIEVFQGPDPVFVPEPEPEPQPTPQPTVQPQPQQRSSSSRRTVTQQPTPVPQPQPVVQITANPAPDPQPQSQRRVNVPTTFSLGPLPQTTFGPGNTGVNTRNTTVQQNNQTPTTSTQQPTTVRTSAPTTQPGSTINTSGLTAYAVAADFAISMPSLGIEGLRIIHPTDLSADGLLQPLDNGVGHLFAFPGNDDKILVYGHSSSYWWDRSEYTRIFRRINELQVDDIVYITYEGNVYSYKITRHLEIPARDDPIQHSDIQGEELILYTCWPPDSIAQRYIVYGQPIGVSPVSS